jgi:hypothetical protein
MAKPLLDELFPGDAYDAAFEALRDALLTDMRATPNAEEADALRKEAMATIIECLTQIQPGTDHSLVTCIARSCIGHGAPAALLPEVFMLLAGAACEGAGESKAGMYSTAMYALNLGYERSAASVINIVSCERIKGE